MLQEEGRNLQASSWHLCVVAGGSRDSSVVGPTPLYTPRLKFSVCSRDVFNVVVPLPMQVPPACLPARNALEQGLTDLWAPSRREVPPVPRAQRQVSLSHLCLGAAVLHQD